MSDRSDRLVKAWVTRRPRLDRTFWTQIQLDGSGCWLWTGTHQGGPRQHRYGYVVREHKRYLAHRYAYMLVNGPIREGFQILHSCDTPLCIKPAHLFMGTALDNIRDMDAKGRRVVVTRYGAEGSGAKLTEAEVAEIRRDYRPRVISYPKLAARYGVGPHTIADVITGKTWKHHAMARLAIGEAPPTPWTEAELRLAAGNR